MPIERLINFSGGENTKEPPEDLPQDQAQLLENVRLVGRAGAVKKRKGHARDNSTVLSGTGTGIRGLYRHYWSSGARTIAAFADKLYAGTGGTYTDITGTATLTADQYWNFESWRDALFAANGTDGHIWKWTGSGNIADITGAPEDTKDVLAIHHRLWAASGSNLYFSDLGDETTWDTTNDVFAIAENDGSEIHRIAAPFGQYIMVFKETSVHMLFGDTIDTFGTRPMFENLGLVAPRSLAVTDNLAIWVSHRGIHLFDGERLHDIGEPKQDEIELALEDDNLQKLMAGGLNGFLYFLSFPSSSSSTENDRTIVYDLRRRAWVSDTRGFNAFAQAIGPGDGGEFYAGDVKDGQVYQLDTGEDDDGSDIKWTVKTRKVDFGERQAIKGLQRIRRDGSIPSSASVTMSFDIDGNTGSTTKQNATVAATSKGQLAEFTLTATDSLDWDDFLIRGVIAEAVFERSALL